MADQTVPNLISWRIAQARGFKGLQLSHGLVFVHELWMPPCFADCQDVGAPPLLHAVALNQLPIVKVLLERRAQIDKSAENVGHSV